MLNKGYEWDTVQHCVKIKELRQAYQNARKSNRPCGAAPNTCCFYEELDVILGSNPISAAKSSVKEVELEDNVEHKTGSSSGAVSQDLFSTPEGSSQSQQSVSSVHDAGEGSSGK
ncbi:hypothetical protein UY3_00062 [Chelonia mydas]|uniref:Zinc finger and SCAN domain-containing protein 29 n=1 Tax=Chelonia mydas TaxID=8469 RepID=M7CMV2_CHEMY|nr:hypothetical protein UY3_00062 [Chelonia mydas]